MAVQSDTLGGLRLTGDDSIKFQQQVRHGRSSNAAKATAAAGRKLADAFLREGRVVVDISTS
jgi:hypothetical protein